MNASNEPVPITRREVRRYRISVAATLALTFGALLLLSVGGVLALTVGANYRNTFDLLGARSTLLVDAMEDSLRTYLGEPEAAVDGIAKLYAERVFDIDDPERMSAILSGALASTKAASAMLIYTDDSFIRGVVRSKEGAFAIEKPHEESSPQILAALEVRRRIDGRQWGAFVASDGGVFANVSVPLMRDNVVKGWIIAPVALQELSTITKDLSERFETHAFILDGNGLVLADERLADPALRAQGLKPLEPVSEYGDPVLARFNEREPLEGFDSAKTRNIEISDVRVGPNASWFNGERRYVAISKQITGYGNFPWTIGAYYGRRQISEEIARVWLSGALGLCALALAVLAAVLLGKRLARPVRTITDHALRVAEFELDGIQQLSRSRVRELDEQAVAFNAMLTGLRAFSTYIPRALVAKLMRSGESDVTQPKEALVTVMFSDIAGFTTLSEQMEAGAAAELLNHHFAILCQAIDAHGGTVDKFLGDGAMAFFGAPDRLKGHGAAAVRAAAAIREALAADNLLGVAEGRPPLHIRIGIHTGPVIVGNIGAADRVNYTIIGDTVNVSQRLQELGKLVAPDEETAIVISGETASRLDERFTLTSAGKHRLRGRGEAIEVFVVGEVVDVSGLVEAKGAA